MKPPSSRPSWGGPGGCPGLRFSDPAGELASHEFGQQRDVLVASVQARHEGEVIAAVLEKALARADRDFLKRFDAVGGEARRHDREIAGPGARQLQNRL